MLAPKRVQKFFIDKYQWQNQYFWFLKTQESNYNWIPCSGIVFSQLAEQTIIIVISSSITGCPTLVA